jgi:hypothetical protein
VPDVLVVDEVGDACQRCSHPKCEITPPVRESRRGGTPGAGANEMDWLRTFLSVRSHHLLNAADPDTRAVWAASAGRCDALLDLADEKEWSLDVPVVLHAFGATHVIE